MEFIKRNYLPAVVFLTGAAVLIIEVVAVRVLAPYFGNTIFTVSSVLTVVLAALSLGYYFGGRLADKQPKDKLFFGIIMLGGMTVLALYWMQVLFLPTLGNNLPLTTGPLITSVLLFLIPSLLLGMLSPFAIKLGEVHFGKEQGLGRIVGTIFFFSTMGSIVGSLSAGFVLVPNFGVGSILLGIGIGLVALGLGPLVLLGLDKKTATKIGAVAAALVILYGLAGPSTNALYDKNGVYERIIIRDGTYQGRPTRFLYQDLNASGAMFLNSDELVYEYTKYWRMQELFTPDVDRALAIGGGSYSVPKDMLKELPESHVDALEIEPDLVDLGEQYFRLPTDEPRLNTPVADGRRYLYDTKEPYDLIFSDVYYSLYSIPMHFTTEEFFQLAHDKLNDQGLFVANVIGSLDGIKPSLILSEVRTLQHVFPNVYLFAVDSPADTGVQNLILVGHKSDRPINFDTAKAQNSKHEVVRTLADHKVDLDQFDLGQYPVLTDDYAPIENWTGQLLRRYVD